jgi:hypothetical protein
MNAGAVDDPEYGHFDVSPEHGGFDFPDELSDRLHRFHHRGKPAWETEDEQNHRLHGEETARRRDPESLYNAVEKIAGIADRLGGGAVSPDVAALLAHMEAMQARLDELEAKQAEPAEAEGDDGEDSQDSEPPAEVKPASKRTPSAVKAGNPE